MNTLKKYKWIWIVVGIIVTLGLAVIVLRQVRNINAAEDQIGETGTAFIGDLAENATASGKVAAQRESALSLASTGVVDKVYVDVGDVVESGDVLVQLETASLERTVASTEKDVAIAEAELSALLADASVEDMAAAEAAVLSARAKLDDLLAGPSAEAIAASEAGLKASQSNVWSASGQVQAVTDVSQADILAAEANLAAALEQQESAHNMWVRLADCQENEVGTYDCVPTESEQMESATQNVQAANTQVTLAQARLDELSIPDGNNVASAQASLSSSSAQYDAALARHEALLLGASEAEIAAAEADLASAQAALENLLSGPSDSEIKIYEIRLTQAETAVREALNALADATLAAPFGGTVTAVYTSEGEHASGLAVRIMDTENLEVVLNVDEIDVGRLAVGQPATVVMETWPEIELESGITAIAPSASDRGNGIISYEVHLNIPETELPILVGMTANADLVTSNLEEVLLVPNSALTPDRENGTFSVDLVLTEADGTTIVQPVEVTVGLRDSRYSEITSGLVEGDVVALGELVIPTIEFGPGGGPFGGD